MKKFVFAIQIFGLMATLPIWILLEMNHGTQSTPTKNMNESAIISRNSLPGDLTYSIAGLPIAALAFGKLNFVSDQKCSNASCTCQSCKCSSNCTCKDF
jgi:hypothetical protein